MKASIFYSQPAGRRAPAVQPVAQAHQRMFPHHARTGVTHDAANLFAPIALIAMHRTFGAGRLFQTEMTSLQPHTRIVQKLFALRAKNGGRVMFIPAIDAHHGLHGLPFSRQAHPGKIIPGFGNRLAHGPQRCRFDGCFHASSFTYISPPDFDAGQGIQQRSGLRFYP